MFRKKVSEEQKYFEKILENNLTFEYKKPFSYDEDKMSFELAEQIIKLIISASLKDKRSIYLRYIGYRDGKGNADYSLQEFKITEFEEVDNIVFGEKIKDINLIKKFVWERDYNFEFLYENSFNAEMLKQLNLFNIELSDLNPNIDCFKEYFFEDYEELEYGIRRKMYPGVGYEYVDFICNKDDVYYNLSLIYDFCDKFKKYLILQDKFSKEFIPYFKSLEGSSYVFEHRNLLVEIIANNKILANELTSEMFIGKFSTKELILEALVLNFNCYQYINDFYKKDDDIINAVIDKNILSLPLIIEYNQIDESNIKEKLKRIIIKEKRQRESNF